VRRDKAEQAAHRLALEMEMEQLRAEGVTGHAALARALNEKAVQVPPGRGAWTHTIVARVLTRAAAGQ
jgi:hypothetical protein